MTNDQFESLPEKRCLDEDVHPAHDWGWMHVRPDVRCPGVQRVCVVCERPIVATSSTGYVHEDQAPGRYNHVAQPKLAHPMDQDPFAGLDDDREA